VRTVSLVGVALLCLQGTTWLAATGNRGWASLTTLTAIVALVGAAYCSYRGLRGFSWLPR
jgi:hypothetical protein